MESIQQMIKTVLNDSQAAVLATVVHVEGSAYRKEGTWMLIRENDSPIGMISGGCLESDLQNRAQALFNTAKTEVIAYDLSAEDDLGWGRGAGCNGVVSVMLRDIDTKFRQALRLVQEDLDEKEPVLFIQSMKDLDKYTFTNKRSDTFGFWDDDLTWEWNGATPFQNIAGQKMIHGATYYIQLLWPKPNLYIIGAGIDARPLAQFAHHAGYAVHLIDWQDTLCNELYFPTAQSIQIGNIEQLLTDIPFNKLDAVVIMTHDFQRDVEILHILKNSQLLYVGVLGSKKRTERLLGRPIPNWIHSPVGLAIGADGPAEIAISIVAQLIATKGGLNS